MLALSLAWLLSRAHGRAAGLFLLETLLVWWLLLALGVGSSFALARHYGSLRSGRHEPRRISQAFGSELVYFAAAWLAMMCAPFRRSGARPAPIFGRSVPRTSSAARKPVLLIHGFSCNAAIWGPVRRRLNAADIGPVIALDLEPLGADLDRYVPALIKALQQLEDATGREPVTLIGHSSGGLAARALLCRIEPRRVRQLITLATPHHGTELARCIPGRQAAQLRPSSPWLRALNAAQDGALPVPTVCIYSLDDNIVTPTESAALRAARGLQLAGVGHFGVLHAPAALDQIESLLRSPLARPP